MTPDQRGNDSGIGNDVADAPGGRGPTRRQALAIAGGTMAALGAGIGPFSHLFVSGAGAAEGDGPPEIVLSAWLVGLELAAEQLYESVAESTQLDDAAKGLAATCGAHHMAQSKALGQMIAATGATAPSEGDKAFVALFEPRITGAVDAAALARVFADLENGFAATYFEAFTTVTSSSLAALIAQILATDAAQATAWSAVENGQGAEKPLPAPDAIPQAQTATDAFDESTLTAPSTTTSSGTASTTTTAQATTTTTGGES